MIAVASLDTAVRIGDRIDGRYRVLDLIAHGGMGTVFLAEHELIKRRVALKVLHTDRAHDVLSVHHFFNEASAAGSLGHPHIVESTDMGYTDDGVPYIVFELLEGPLLSTIIDDAHGLPYRRAVRIARQIASALDTAHAAGIVHLDLKSDNIFLVERDGSSDHVKVIDFGIACYLGRDKHACIAGTPEYMAPEQITAPATVDARTDIYALGVVLYEMIAARCPIGDLDRQALMRRVVLEDAPPLRGVPPALSELVHSMLAKHPEDRPSSMAAIVAELEPFAREPESVFAEPAPRPTPPIQLPVATAVVSLPTPPPMATRGWPVPLLALSLVAVAAGVACTLVETKHLSDVREAAVKRLDDDVTQLASAIDAETKNIHERAAIIAGTPLLRSAITTDAATLDDLANQEHVLGARGDETISVLQRAGTSSTELLRMPRDAKPFARGLHVDAGRPMFGTSEPILLPSRVAAGDVAIMAPLHLDTMRARFAEDSLAASLHGFAQPFDLAATREPSAAGEDLIVPLRLASDVIDAPLAVHARLRSPASSDMVVAARTGSFALSGAFGACFLAVGVLRRKRRRS